MVWNERCQKKEKYIFSILSTHIKKPLKEKLSKDCFTGKRSCTHFVIRHRGESDAFG